MNIFFCPLLSLLILVPTSLSSCEIDDYDDDTCSCPDINNFVAKRLLNITTFISQTSSCTWNFTCTNSSSCAAQQSLPNIPCGFIIFDFENLENYTIPDVNWYLPLIRIDANYSVNIFEELGFQCDMGSWYVTKFPWGIFYETYPTGNGNIPPENLVGVRARLNHNDQIAW